MDLIKIIDNVITSKLGWEHGGLITNLAEAKLYGDVGANVEMTSTPSSSPIHETPRPSTHKELEGKSLFGTANDTYTAYRIVPAPIVDSPSFTSECTINITPTINKCKESPQAVSTPLTNKQLVHYDTDTYRFEHCKSPRIATSPFFGLNETSNASDVIDVSDASPNVSSKTKQHRQQEHHSVK